VQIINSLFISAKIEKRKLLVAATNISDLSVAMKSAITALFGLMTSVLPAMMSVVPARGSLLTSVRNRP
jgi:hypothetical protein